MTERVVVATVNPHAFATLGSVYDLAAVMHALSKFPGVYIATEGEGVLSYVVDVPETETTADLERDAEAPEGTT